MTPFGARMRTLREARGISLRRMAADLMVSPAYLSALEHGKRGRPSAGLIRQVCAYFDIIWDEAEALAALAEASHPRIVVDTATLTPAHTELANRLAQRIGTLPPATVAAMLALLEESP